MTTNVEATAFLPDWVIEVRSPSDRWNDIFIKVGEYLNAGVRCVIVLDPETRSASVYCRTSYHPFSTSATN